MLTHRGFSAWIVCDDQPVPEYLVAVEEGHNRVSCWIPSEEGKQFSVFWQDHGGNVDTCGYITLDGFVVPGRFLFGQGITSRSGVRSGPSTERPFVFKIANAESRDPNSSSQPNPSSSRDLGTITLRIKQIQRVGSRAANSLIDIPLKVLGKRKAGDLCIGFGQDKQVYYQSPVTWAVKPYAEEGSKPSSYVTFVFRYRSAEFLQAQGIMPESKPSRPSTLPKRVPVRRIVSAPTVSTQSYATESPLATSPNDHKQQTLFPEPTPSSTPSPRPLKKRKKECDFLANGPYRLRRPSDMRRAISWRAPNTIPSSTYEGTIEFNNPFGGTLPESEEGTDESSGEVSSSSPTLVGSSQGSNPSPLFESNQGLAE